MLTFNTVVGFLGKEPFWENIVAGLAVMALEFILIYIVVGRWVSKYQKKQWDGTRQSLTRVLLTAMARVVQHMNACLIIRDDRVFLKCGY